MQFKLKSFMIIIVLFAVFSLPFCPKRRQATGSFKPGIAMKSTTGLLPRGKKNVQKNFGSLVETSIWKAKPPGPFF